jgi:hypothetical protein
MDDDVRFCISLWLVRYIPFQPRSLTRPYPVIRSCNSIRIAMDVLKIVMIIMGGSL